MKDEVLPISMVGRAFFSGWSGNQCTMREMLVRIMKGTSREKS